MKQNIIRTMIAVFGMITILGAGYKVRAEDMMYSYNTYETKYVEDANGSSAPYQSKSTKTGTSHTHQYVWVDDNGNVVPDCVTSTTAHYVCKICGAAKASQPSRSAVGHKYNNSSWVIDVEPTCTTPGKKHQVCRVCGGGIRYENTVIPATGHDWKWEITQTPTCTKPGLKHQVCQNANCNATQNEDTQYADAKGHDFMTATIKTNQGLRSEATCTENATYYQKCRNCNAFDENAYNEIKGTALSHKWTWVIDRAPGCETIGIKHQECSICGSRQSTGTIIPKHGHKWYKATLDLNNGIVEEATCKKNAKYYQKCEYCDKQDPEHTNRVVGTKLPHTFVNGYCSVCNTKAQE